MFELVDLGLGVDEVLPVDVVEADGAPRPSSRAATRPGSATLASRPASRTPTTRDITYDQLRAGDTLVNTRLDRMGRSVLHLVTVGAELRGCDVGLQVLEQGIDTATAEGRAMFGMLAVLASCSTPASSRTR